MPARSSIRVMLVALALVVCVPFGRLALAGVTTTVTCCCGEHEAGEDCGCPSCPAATGDESDDPDDGEPGPSTIRRCQTSSELGTCPLDAPFVLPDGLDDPDGVALPCRVAVEPVPDEPFFDPPPRPS